MSNISKQVLNNIQDKKPKPKWEFLLKNYVIWFLFAISIIIGSLAVSIIIFMLRNNAPAFLIKLPLFWIVILGIFLFLAFYNMQHTEKGYKYSSYIILLISVLISIALGSLIYSFGIADNLEKGAYNRFPIYQKMMHMKAKSLNVPEKGMLAGIIYEDCKLKCFDNKIWDISAKECKPINMRVMLKGEQLSDNEFRADYIIPWFERKPPKMRINK